MGRNFYQRRPSSIFILPVLFLLAVAACTKPQIAFQNVYNGDNATNVIAIDTFAVQLSTVFLDSFATSGTQTQLLGKYVDAYFGSVVSKSFTDIGVPAPLPTLTDFSVYDSIVLIMRINKSFYGDTTQVQRYKVSQLTQVMNYPVNQNYFFNNDSIPYNPEVLASADVIINPVSGITSQRIGDTIKMKMPQSMGQELFNLLYRQPDTITNSQTFRGYFKGLTVYPDESLPGAMYGFLDTMVLRIYYHQPGVVTQQLTADFKTINASTQFNHITVDRTGTAVQNISASNPVIPSSQSNNRAFFQPITSLYVKLQFPTITNLLAYQDYLAIMRAELIVKPEKGTYSPTFSLPPLVNLALAGEGNALGSTLTTYGTGHLTIDYLYGTNTSYSYDITGYIQNAVLQGAPYNQKNGLLLVFPTGLNSILFNRAVFGDQFNQSKSNQVSLKIYYASYY